MAVNDKSANDKVYEPKDRTLDMTLVERLHVQKALQVYLKSIERARNNEIAGSDVYRHRTSDIDVVRAILNRVS